jgi:methyl-accepting chemotaxis protein
MAGDLEDIVRRLAESSNKIEDGFVVVGNYLNQSLRHLQETEAGFSLFLERLDNQTAARSKSSLIAAADQVERIGQEIGGSKSSLQGLVNLTGGLARRIDQIDATLKAASFLSVNAKIAAAGLSDGSTDFSAFAAEIFRLLSQAQISIAGFGRDLAQLNNRLEEALRTQGAFEHRHGLLMREACDHLRRSVTVLEAQRSQAQRASDAIAHRSADTKRKIGEAVRALQVGDATRQRVEHAASMIDAGRGANLPTDARTWWQGLSREEQAAVKAAACRLQARQLRHAAGDFDREAISLSTTMMALSQGTREIGTLGLEVSGAAVGKGGTFFDQLAATIREASSLLGEYVDARAQIDAAVRTVAQNIDELGQHMKKVDSIETDIRLMGLNTTLRCARIGDQGRALSVIAQELRIYADQIAQQAETVFTDLDQLTSEARQLSQSADAEGEDKTAEVLAGISGTEAEFTALGSTLAAALSALEQNAQSAAVPLQKTAEAMRTQQALSAIMARAADDLDAAVADIPDTGATETIQAHLRTLGGSHYTMESQRVIHQLFAVGDAAAVATTPVNQAEQSLADILF